MNAARNIWALHAVGFLALGLVPMNALLMALWGVELGAAPATIGLMVGIRSLLPLFLSLHAGALIDRLGSRRVMLAAAVIGALTVPLYLAAPYVWVAIVLQIVGGFTQQVIWIAAQSSISGGSDRRGAAAFSFFSIVGSGAGPLLVGAAWSALGAAPTFAIAAVWSAALIPLAAVFRARDDLPGRGQVSATDFVPRASDYANAWKLLRTPSIGYVVSMTFFRLAIIGIQSSLYVVFLQGAGLEEAKIGVLLAITAVATAVASFLVMPLGRFFSDAVLLNTTTALAIVCVASTPLLPDYATLIVAATLLGLCSGVGAPVILAVVAAGSGSTSRGLGFGLRGTANRLSTLVVPWGMGVAADLISLRASFFVIGGALLAGLAASSLYYRRVAP